MPNIICTRLSRDVGRVGLAHQRALAQDGHRGAQVLHVLQLVRDEDDGHALGGERLQGGEQLFLLRLADARGRLVEDQDPGPSQSRRRISSCWRSPDGEGVDIGLRVQGEAELGGQLAKLLARLPPVREQASLRGPG